MAAQYLALDSFWVDKCRYDDAERAYYEGQGNEILTPLADEVARARQRLNAIRDNVEDAITSKKVPDQCGKTVEPEVIPVQAQAPAVVQPAQTVEPEKKNNIEQTSDTKPAQEKETSKPPPICNLASMDVGVIKFLEKKVASFENVMQNIQKQLDAFSSRLDLMESKISPSCPVPVCKKPSAAPAPAKDDDGDDDVDLFGSDSEDDEAANKVKEERLAAYNAKKSKKPALIAKSSIILDVKPWDDETDMKAMEAAVREIEMDGLLWGASKLVPLAYGIHKLQINCVVEDEKVSIDLLQEKIEAIEDFVQSVDIAAFNKI